MRKRVLAIVATLAMVMTMIPTVAFAGTAVTTISDFKTALGGSEQEITYTLSENVNMGNEKIVIPKGKKVTIDLNGHTISGKSDSGYGNLFYVENAALLTVKDSVGSGKITYAAGASNQGTAVDLEGKLVLESGTIEITGTWSIGFVVDVCPNAWGNAYTDETVFEMNGGKLVSSDAAVRVSSTSSSGYDNIVAKFVMNGGKIDAVYDGIFVQHQGDGAVTGGHESYVVINNGNISSDFAPIRIYGTNPVEDVDIEINGGNFEYTGGESTGWIVEGFLKGTSEAVVDEAVIEVSGGTFDGDISEYLEEGLKWDATTGKVIDPNAPVAPPAGGNSGNGDSTATTPTKPAKPATQSKPVTNNNGTTYTYSAQTDDTAVEEDTEVTEETDEVKPADSTESDSTVTGSAIGGGSVIAIIIGAIVIAAGVAIALKAKRKNK